MNLIRHYCIKQIEDIGNTPYAFRSWDCAKEQFDHKDYKRVCNGEIECESVEDGLDQLFAYYNGDTSYTSIEEHKRSKMHSLSVSDVVVVDQKYYYCDSFGWVEVR